MDIESVKNDLKEILSEKRYNHSVGTMKMAKILAKQYGEDEEKAEFTGLIHDIAKELSKEKIDEYIKKYNIEIDEIEKKQLGLLHAKLGAYVAKEKYEIADEEVQNAIKYHTTGNKDMDTFAKIIYVADKIEENRTYDGVEELREMAMKDLESAILFIVDFVIQKSIKNKSLIHPNTIEVRNNLLMNHEYNIQNK